MGTLRKKTREEKPPKARKVKKLRLRKVKEPKVKVRKVKKRPIRTWWRNLSLKTCFMAYMLIAIVVGGMLCIFTMAILADMPHELVWHRLEAENATDYMSYYHVDDEIHVYYEEDTGAEWGETGTRVVETYIRTYPLDDRERFLFAFQDVAMGLSIPVFLIGAIMVTGLLFYRNRLKKPIERLNMAYKMVATNDLEFEMPIDREDELGRLCRSFESMRLALVQNNRKTWRAMEERRRLNAAFSHDLRTPLTVLGGYTQMLKRYDLGRDKQSEMLSAMGSHIERMTRYVSDMSALQKMEDIEPRSELVELGELTRSMAADAQILADGRSLSLGVDDYVSAAVFTDPSIIRQVFENLMGNAVRFAASRVTIEYKYASGRFSLTVLNDGKPFTKEELTRATEPYYSSGDENNVHFGLGLCIARMLTQKLSGDLALFNPVDGGAAVTATFMLQPA